MNPLLSIIPRPEPLPLPAPAWLLWSLLMLTFVVHVVAMNLLVGTSVIAAAARLRQPADANARELVGRLMRPMPVLVAATVTFGVAPLLFLQVLYGRLFFTSSVLMAVPWLAIVPALVVLYYGVYGLAFRANAGKAAPALWHVAIAIGLLAVGLVYTANMSLMLGADKFGALYAASGRGLHFGGGDPALWPRWMHMMLGAAAVGGLAVAWLGIARMPAQPAFGRWATRHGARWAAWATGVNLLVGVWWLVAIPWPTLERLLTGGVAGPTFFGVSLLFGLATFTALVLLAVLEPSRRLTNVATLGMGLTIVFMAFTRDQLRSVGLERIGFEPVRWVSPQWVPLGLFVVFLLIGGVAVVWMARVLWRAEGARQHDVAA